MPMFGLAGHQNEPLFRGLRAKGARLFVVALLAVSAVLVPGLTGPARADDLSDARAEIANAVATVESVRNDANFTKDLEPYLQRARAVMVIPSYYKGGFIIGGSYGVGLLMVRDDQGKLTPPAFYSVVGGSLGLQIGGQRAQMILMIMTENGLNSVLSDNFKMGASAGVSFASVGANIEASTTANLDADIIAFAHSQGAYGGGVFEGAGLVFRDSWNRAVYGPNASAKAILFDRRWVLPDADNLHRLLGVQYYPPQRSNALNPDAPPAQEEVPASSSGSSSSWSSGSSGGSSSGNSAPASAPAASSRPSSAPVKLTPVQKQDLN